MSERERFIEVVNAAIRGAVHFAGEALSIVDGGLSPHVFRRTQVRTKLAADLRAMEQFLDHLRD